MRILWELIKNIFYKNKVEFITRYNIYNNISTLSFINKDLLHSIYTDIVVLIVKDDFMIDPAKILAFFEYNYNFTKDELCMLSFKIGILTNTYVRNPTMLLEDAGKLTDIFTKEKIVYIKKLLDKQIKYNEDNLIEEYNILEKKKEEEDRLIRLKNKDPDALIDDWIKKHKKE